MKPIFQADFAFPLIIFILFCPFIEILFWNQRFVLHTLLLLSIVVWLIFLGIGNLSRLGFQNPIAFAFLLTLVSLTFLSKVDGVSLHRSTWSLFIIGFFFVNMQYPSKSSHNFNASNLNKFRNLLKISLVGHIVAFVFSKNNYEKLMVTEINLIPLLAIGFALGIYTKDKFLTAIAVLATYCSYSFSLQLSTILVFLAIPISTLISRLKPKLIISLLVSGMISYLAAYKFLLKNFLIYSLNFTDNNVGIRIQMNTYAQSIIDQNPLIGGKLAAPLTLPISRGANSSELPFHSDVTTLLVACGAIGLFFYISNIALVFYKSSTTEHHEIFHKVARVGVISSLLTGIINPVYPGYLLLFSFALCII